MWPPERAANPAPRSRAATRHRPSARRQDRSREAGRNGWHGERCRGWTAPRWRRSRYVGVFERRLAAQRLGEIFGQSVGHIDAVAVDAAVGPESQRGEEVVAYLAVVPVEVGLLTREQMAIPLPVGHPGPRWAAEVGDPVRRWLRALWARTVAEDVAGPGGRARLGGQCLLEPRVQIRRVVGHDVDDHPDTDRVRRRNQGIEILQSAELRCNVAVVGHVVTTVSERRGVERAQPDGIDAEGGQITDPRRHTANVAHAVGIAVGEASWIDLIDHRLTPPVGVASLVSGKQNLIGHETIILRERISRLKVRAALSNAPSDSACNQSYAALANRVNVEQRLR